jgi:NRPS condensation-like uncharacterized protein
MSKSVGSMPGTKMYPATTTQALFWTLHQATPGDHPYTLSMSFLLRGMLDLPMFEIAWGWMAASEPSLRTIFVELEGSLYQEILPQHRIAFRFYESGPSGPDPDRSDGEAFFREGLRESFELSQEPPARVRILRLAEDRHLLQVVMHHIIADNATKIRFLHRLSHIYNSLKSGAADQRLCPGAKIQPPLRTASHLFPDLEAALTRAVRHRRYGGGLMAHPG